MKFFGFVLAAILNKSENTELEVMQVEKVFCHLQVNSNMTPFFFLKGSSEFHTKFPLPKELHRSNILNVNPCRNNACVTDHIVNKMG